MLRDFRSVGATDAAPLVFTATFLAIVGLSLSAAGPPLISVATIIIEAAPRFAIFEAWAPRTMVLVALTEVAPQLLFGLQAAVVTNEPAVEVRGAHLPKIAEGGAASVGMAPAIKQIKSGPPL
jgi:hypothetical protein